MLEKFRVRFVLFVFVCLLFSCSSNEETKVLRLAMPTTPYTLDPRLALERGENALALMLFDGLYRMEDGIAQFAVAKKVMLSEDGKTYTFQLKKTYWTNGDLVSAHDFEYAWKNQLNPSFKSPSAYQLFPLLNAKGAKEGVISLNDVGVKALDDFTLEVHLEYPLAHFPQLLATPAYFPINRLVNKKNAKWPLRYSRDFVSNGPFAMRSWKLSKYLDFIKNPNYWDKRAVFLQKIKIDFLSENPDTNELKRYQEGHLDWAGAPLSILPAEEFAALEKREDFHTYPISASYWYIFNTQKPPFSYENCRKAFAYALNRKALLAQLTDSKHLPATRVVPPTQKDNAFEKSLEDNASEEALELFEAFLQDKGWTRNTFPQVVITLNDTQDHIKVAQIIKDQWEEVFRIPVVLEKLPWTAYLDKLSKAEFQVGRFGWVANYDDPLVFLELFKDKNSPNNLTGWEDKNYQTLLDEVFAEQDLRKRKHKLYEAEAYLLQKMPLIPLFHYQNAYLKNPQLQKVDLSSTGLLDFKRAIK